MALDFLGNVVDAIANHFEAKNSRAWQEEMWNKQNEYNLPVHQRERLEAAGINPNLAFGSAASTMSASIPSSPGYPTHSGLGKAFSYALEKKQVLSNIAKQNEDTKRESMQNQVMEYLLEDKKRHDAKQLASEEVEFDWNLRNKMRALDIQFETNKLKRDYAEWANENARLDAEIKLASKEHEWLKVKMLERERKHLNSKYRFEDLYYDSNLNPYETSTIAGGIRTVHGLFGKIYKDLGFKPGSRLDLDGRFNKFIKRQLLKSIKKGGGLYVP